jgi:DNA topoisomerase-1
VPIVQGNYVLVIAEKPDAARRIAYSLGNSRTIKISGIEVFDIPEAFDKNRYVVCSASGHLYRVADPTQLRRIYPIFDSEWVPSQQSLFHHEQTNKKRRAKNSLGKFGYRSGRRLAIIARLADHANTIVQACDYDIEGETIGSNIIRFACSNSTTSVSRPLRAKFSTLTQDEVRAAFSQIFEMKAPMAEAGRAKHTIDFVWGINLSRALSEAYRSAKGKFRNLTIGRVQGPALGFVVEREMRIKTHVAVPYWNLEVTFQKAGIKFKAQYEKGKVDVKKEVQDIYAQISNINSGTVLSLTKETQTDHPPFPFNIGDLQREAFRLYKFSPSTTLSIAEKLYLLTLISYPRTSSQKLPFSIGYSRIIDALLEQTELSNFRFQMQACNRREFPIQGNKDDPAHPAIYPTGQGPVSLNNAEKKIYDLISRRFLACFAEDSLSERLVVKFLIGKLTFVSKNETMKKLGWRSVYPSNYEKYTPLPTLEIGEKVPIVESNIHSKFTTPPPRYNEASLLTKMETYNIGTKATRAETISTLVKRDYILRDKIGELVPTDTGLSLYERLEKSAPSIIGTDLTREIDEGIEKILDGEGIPETLIAKSLYYSLSVLEQIHRLELQNSFSLPAWQEATDLTKKISPRPR